MWLGYSLLQGLVGSCPPHECLDVDGDEGDGMGAVFYTSPAVPDFEMAGSTVVQECGE